MLRAFAVVVLASMLGCASLQRGDLGFYQSLVDPVPTAWLDVAAPSDHVSVRRIASFVEVSGRAGFREIVDHDVVVPWVGIRTGMRCVKHRPRRRCLRPVYLSADL